MKSTRRLCLVRQQCSLSYCYNHLKINNYRIQKIRYHSTNSNFNFNELNNCNIVIKKAISEEVRKRCDYGYYTEDEVISTVTVSKSYKFGDYSINVSKLNSIKPVPSCLIESIGTTPSIVTSSPLLDSTNSQEGYINFKINNSSLYQLFLPQIIFNSNLTCTYGQPSTPLPGTNKTVIIEYSSPNIAKPFHAGASPLHILG